MYADHHVIEVRRILLKIPGVEDVYASSSFEAVEVTFDPKKTDTEVIKARLGEAGYIEDLALPVESGAPATDREGADDEAYFRHTATYQTGGNVVSFGRRTPHTGRPLWPCPGMGLLSVKDEED